MEEAEKRLSHFSAEDVRNLILDWASEEHPSKRQAFLDRLILSNQNKEVVCDVESLMDEINAFTQRVEDGEYCEGWGWDEAIREERDWGDESWANSLKRFESFIKNRVRIEIRVCKTRKHIL